MPQTSIGGASKRRPPKAPASRVYSSEPLPRQTRFPPRRRIAAPNRKMGRSILPGKTESQQTITQIGFVRSFSSSEMMDDPIPIHNTEHDDDEEEDEMRWIPNKRRRFRKSETGSEEVGYQSTLTQANFFVQDSFDDEDDDVADAAENFASLTGPRQGYHDGNLDGANDHDMEDGENAAPPVTFPSSQRPSNTSAPESSQSRRIFKIPRTPRRAARREVPSSQSPAETPSSTNATPSQRTPLGEMNKNSIKHRDSSPSFRASQSVKARKSIDYELEENDDENWDPCSNISKPVSSKRKRQASPQGEPQSPSIPNEPASYFEYPQQLQLDFSSPSVHGRAHIGSSAEHNSSPQHMMRSSQATTVDITQHSPLSWPRPIKQEPFSNFEIHVEEGLRSPQQQSLPGPASSGVANNAESVEQFRFQFGSTSNDGDTTMSQLLPASLLRDMHGEF